MSNKNKKNTAKYSNPDEAPITYGSNEETTTRVESVVDEIVTDHSSVIVETTNNSDVNDDSPVTSEPEEVKKSVTEVKVEKKIANETAEIPETAFTNYVKVRIAGRSRLAGYRMMSPVTIANMILENTSGDYSVLTSSQTAKLVCKIIREYSHMLRVNGISIERREQFIKRFENDLKRFKF